MNKKILFILFLFFAEHTNAQIDFTRWVNPFIGTGGHGHTFPGATLPFGMVQLSPDTRMDDWDGSSGYHYSDSVIYGFSHTHLNGTGVPDYCDILFQPFTGDDQWTKEEYRSPFSHKNEKASAGFYSVHLDKYNIDVALTATLRTGLHQYRFPADAAEGKIMIDLNHRDKLLDAYIEQTDDYTIKGYRFSQSWAKNQKIFFAAHFSKPIKKTAFRYAEQKDKLPAAGENKNKLSCILNFDCSDNRTLLVKVAISPVDMDGALNNLEKEQPGFDFEGTVQKAKTAWNKELGKIEVSGGTADQQTIFYSALYRTLIQPNIYQDVDGRFRSTDDKIHNSEGFENYTVFSLWDTHRAYHPLMSIINKKRTTDWINTFLAQYKYGGMLPVWELSANETFCMIGYHAVPVILDAFMKGVRGFDEQLALKAMNEYATSNRFGIREYAKTGFLSNDVEQESVSKTLEYAYDDWCIAQFALRHSRNDLYNTYIRRAQSYKNVFDPVTRFMRGKMQSSWYSPFQPTEINHFYTEGNSWQYSFYAPHDISGLIDLYGGPGSFYKKLKELFYTTEGLTGRDQADVTGLIGQYAHGNEPSHHAAYLFNYVGKPFETQKLVYKICNEFYRNTPDGIEGNEDCGQMSAWYIFSALGFYPVCPGNNEFALGTPLFDKAILHLENGKDFVITANRKNQGEQYIQSIAINGKTSTQSFIRYNDMQNGGELVFHCSEKPVQKFGREEKDWPVSLGSAVVQNGSGQADTYVSRNTPNRNTGIIPSPFVVGETSRKFRGYKTVALGCVNKQAEIFYSVTINDSVHTTTGFLKYTGPFTIGSTVRLSMYSQFENRGSPVTEQLFNKIPEDKEVTVLSKVNPLYPADGPVSLIDGIYGTVNWRAGEWQSYYGTDFEAVVDLKTVKTISFAGGHFLQDIGSWIWPPRSLQFSVSNDGISFTNAGTVPLNYNERDEKAQLVQTGIPLSVTARFVKIKAINYGVIPAWHLGAGGNAHIFVSELIIK